MPGKDRDIAKIWLSWVMDIGDDHLRDAFVVVIDSFS